MSRVVRVDEGSAYIIEWIRADSDRMTALATVRDLDLPDWCIAAGFVRNLVWDRLHGFKTPTPLNDLDVLYFDNADTNESKDRALEACLKDLSDRPWSVKNQARMHRRNQDNPYASSADAMSYWVEVETAIGVRLNADDRLELIAPFGVQSLLAGEITLNSKRPKPSVFNDRIKRKNWLTFWPKLRVVSDISTQ